MLKNIAKAIAVTAIAGGAVLVSAGGASAAHCLETVNGVIVGDTPGFSYFGTDHVKDSPHADGPEGGNPGPHMGTSGASNCRDTTGSPSERAPGQNKP